MGSLFLIATPLQEADSALQPSTKLTSKTFTETLAFILPRHRPSGANTIVAGSLSARGPTLSSKGNTLAKVPSGNITILQL